MSRVKKDVGPYFHQASVSPAHDISYRACTTCLQNPVAVLSINAKWPCGTGRAASKIYDV